MSNKDEIELRKWCLEFIMDQREYLGVSDLTMEAEAILDWIKGGEDRSAVKSDYVGGIDWSGFEVLSARSGDGHRLQAPDGRYVCLPAPISFEDASGPLKDLWIEIYGIPNKGKEVTND